MEAMIRMLSLLIILYGYAAFPSETTFKTLFTLRRSTNANVLVYQACLTPKGTFCDEPVQVHWIMKTANDAIEPLTGLERQKAYGVVFKKSSENEVVFYIKPLPKREIVLKKDLVATTLINGQLAILQEGFIKTGKGLIPKVKYIELMGKSLNKDNSVKERIEKFD
jgi:hypothetical protein